MASGAETVILSEIDAYFKDRDGDRFDAIYKAVRNLPSAEVFWNDMRKGRQVAFTDLLDSIERQKTSSRMRVQDVRKKLMPPKKTGRDPARRSELGMERSSGCLFKLRQKLVDVKPLSKLQACCFFLIVLWLGVLIWPYGWRTQQSTMFSDGYKVGLWKVEYKAAGFKGPMYIATTTVAIFFAAAAPGIGIYVASATLWAKLAAYVLAPKLFLSTLVLFGGWIGALGPIVQLAAPIVTECGKGAVAMYLHYLGVLKKEAPAMQENFKPVASDNYFWDEAGSWGPEWNSLRLSSMIMFTAGVVVVFAYIFAYREIKRVSDTGSGGHRLTVAVQVAAFFAVFGVLLYTFLSPTTIGSFDWVYGLACLNVLISLWACRLESGYRQSRQSLSSRRR